jgi:hypothetical protein
MQGRAQPGLKILSGKKNVHDGEERVSPKQNNSIENILVCNCSKLKYWMQVNVIHSNTVFYEFMQIFDWALPSIKI